MKNSPWIQMDFDIWEEVCDPAYVLHLPKQSYIFHQGDVTEHVHIVKSGRVLLSAFSENGAEKILMFITKGGIIGEQSLYAPTVVPYSARTVSETTLYKIPVETFIQYIVQHTDMMQHVIRGQLLKESALISHIVDLSFRDAYHRAVHELLFCADNYGEPVDEGILIKIPISQEGLGKRIQASRITVNKVLKRLTQENLVGRRGQHFVLFNIDKLEKIDGE